MSANKTSVSSGDTGEKKKIEEKLGLEEIVKIGKRFRQLGLYLFVWYWYQIHKDGVDLQRLWRFYNNISTHVVHVETVRKQLRMLMNKGLIEEKNGKFYPIPLPVDVAIKLFDMKRSRAGKRGAVARLKQIVYRDQLPLVRELPKGLRHYVKQVITRAVQLAGRGRHDVALDLLAHTLLPIRENGVLWLWRRDEFIYYERKTMNEGTFHCVRFPALAKLLKSLGFKEGVMVWHIYGHREAKKLIHKIFGKGHLSWAWARSIGHKLKQLGFAEEGHYYIVEIEYRNMMLLIYLRDIYNNLLKEYLEPWFDENNLPLPLTPSKTKVRYPVLGKQHVKEENEESYFARW